MSIPIAIELYSVRNDCAQDLCGVLEKVAQMGYEGVEFAGFHGKGAAEIKAVLDRTGLKVAGSHTGIGLLEPDKIDATLEFMRAIGCEYVIVPGLPEEMRNTPEACLVTADRFTDLSGTLVGRGFRAGYHCHFGDVVPLSNGETAWYMIAEHTPPEFVMQYDTANGMSGGADPVKPILDFPGRGETVHLKEWAGAHGAALIGDGDVPWGRVFDACESGAGTKWYIVEHEDESLMPPMEAVEKCLQNLRKMGK
jgi:sugar phosphate isomerase/epimerase